jgi:hypothetical protein
MPGSSRRGAALIDVLLAIILLAVSGTALVTLVGQTAHSIESLHESEHRTRAAADRIDALSVLDRAALESRVGQRSEKGLIVDIARIRADLFDVRVLQPTNGAVLLRTTLYRPDTTNDRAY